MKWLRRLYVAVAGAPDCYACDLRRHGCVGLCNMTAAERAAFWVATGQNPVMRDPPTVKEDG